MNAVGWGRDVGLSSSGSTASDDVKNKYNSDSPSDNAGATSGDGKTSESGARLLPLFTSSAGAGTSGRSGVDGGTGLIAE